jgi:FtsZ-binding cell division protein ZapB
VPSRDIRSLPSISFEEALKIGTPENPTNLISVYAVEITENDWKRIKAERLPLPPHFAYQEADLLRYQFIRDVLEQDQSPPYNFTSSGRVRTAADIDLDAQNEYDRSVAEGKKPQEKSKDPVGKKIWAHDNENSGVRQVAQGPQEGSQEVGQKLQETRQRLQAAQEKIKAANAEICTLQLQIHVLQDNFQYLSEETKIVRGKNESLRREIEWLHERNHWLQEAVKAQAATSGVFSRRSGEQGQEEQDIE